MTDILYTKAGDVPARKLSKDEMVQLTVANPSCDGLNMQRAVHKVSFQPCYIFHHYDGEDKHVFCTLELSMEVRAELNGITDD